MNVSAEADAFLQGLQEQVQHPLPGPPGHQPAHEQASAADLIKQAQAAAASLSASVQAQPAQLVANGTPNGEAASAADEERRRKRRNRWGNPAADVAPAPVTQAPQPAAPSPAPAAAAPAAEPEKKKRRSRWEDPDGAGETAMVAIKPKELVLPGGIKVRLRGRLPDGCSDEANISASAHMARAALAMRSMASYL